MIVSVIGDEVAHSFENQVKVLSSLGIKNIEIRKIKGTNIVECDFISINNVIKLLRKSDLSVSMLSTNIGKRKRDIAGNNTMFQRSLELGELLSCKYIRIFSDLTPKAEETKKLLEQYIAMAKEKNIELLLENEIGTYADSPQHCKSLLQELECKLKILYDPGNFFRNGFDVLESYNNLKNYISYIHLKDLKADTYEWTDIGEGDMQTKLLLRSLCNEKYMGYISLEPFLRMCEEEKRIKTFVRYYHNFENIYASIKKECNI